MQNVIDTGPIGGAVDRLAAALAGNAQVAAVAQIAGAQIVADAQAASAEQQTSAARPREQVQLWLSLVILASVAVALLRGKNIPFQVSA